MPSILSKELIKNKILGTEWSFGYNCYEVGHTWTPSCTDAALEISTAAAAKIVPLYAMLYSFSQLAVQKKYDLESSLDTVKSIARSSFFIFFHAYNGALMGCALRNSLGRFYYRVLVCMPALLSSYLALLIERPSRRQALAFYMLNLASEIVYRMAVAKGLFTPIVHGETLLFALSLGAWYHLIRQHGFGHDPVSAAVKLLVGRHEAKSRGRAPIDGAPEPTSVEEAWLGSGWLRPLERLLEGRAHARWLLGDRHPSCRHPGTSCLGYTLGPAPSRFLLGFGVQLLLGLSSRPLELVRAPRAALVASFTSPRSWRFGLFLSSLVCGGRLVSCLLRRHSDGDAPWHGFCSGFAAGLSMFLAPRSSLSMYVMWKAVEQYYLLAKRQERVRYFEFTILSIYAFSAATILYAFALEPKFVRPSYMKFLDNLSNHRLHQLNRMVLDVFGTGSSIGYEDYFPDLDPRLMSNQFKELVFNWMIQPYE